MALGMSMRPEPLTLQLTRREAHAVLRALATANDVAARSDSKHDRDDIQPNTWVAKRLLSLLESEE